MTGQQLKNSILQLAIQGKLVPQDPNDEPASELLNRIRKEKEQLVKAGKLKKKDLEVIPIAEDEKPFEIPESWEWCRLNDIVELITKGSSPSWQGVKYTNEGILFVTSENVGVENLLLNSPKYLEPKFNEIQPRSILKKGDILTNIVGASIGRSAIFNLDICDANINQAVSMVRLIEHSLSPYLIKLFNSYFFIHQILGKVVETARPNVSLNSVSNLCIPLPPLAEQKRIVAKIEELLPLVEEYGNAQEELNILNATLPDKLRQSILQEAIMGKLVPQDPNDEPASKLLERIQEEKKRLVKEGKLKKKDLEVTPITDDEKPFDLPNGWEWCRLSDISTFNGGFAFKSTDYVSKEKGIRVLRISDFNENGIINKNPVYHPAGNKFEDYSLCNGDIVMCMTGGTVGKSLHVKELGEKMYVNQRVADIRINKVVFDDYVYFVICSTYIKSIIEDSKNSTNDNISAKLIQDFIIPLPPLAEQHRIVAKLEEILPKLNEIK